MKLPEIIFGLVSTPFIIGMLSTDAIAGGPPPLDCIISPSVTVEITSPVEGILAEVLVDIGDVVRKGEVLARLVSDVEKVSLELAELHASNEAALISGQSRYDYYLAKLERTSQLLNRGAAATEAFERAETEFIIAENDLLAARQDSAIANVEIRRVRAVLDLKTIRSPLDAIVTERFLHAGAFVGGRAVVLQLAKLDPLKVRVFVPIELKPLVDQIEGAKVTPQPPFDRIHDARKTVVDSVFDVASGTFSVYLEIENPEHSIPAGLKCKLQFPAATTAVVED
jgi:RND family efflux transporter MFP subunit